uniref:Phosphoheptose isomerase n=1 Tax=uncultured beta proteobacterium HF0130_04F21 TaxID=710819 RepID=E0XSU5_9PROT|nr:phosphoheptose isomerase [uncultured beta proteobacterium HF0130_04F21]
MSFKRLEGELSEHIRVMNTIRELFADISSSAEVCSNALEKGQTIFFCGNGGSASDSQHLATELIGRFKKNRRPLAAYSLTADSTAITCIANDFGYEQIFARQLEGLAKHGDVLFAISTSGNSKNVVNCVKIAKKIGVYTICLSGGSGGELKKLCDKNLIVESTSETARIQEAHIFIGQVICRIIETNLGLES